MKNNKGFGKFEVLTMIVIILLIGAYLMYSSLGGISSQKLKTMKNSAIKFSDAVNTNISSFHNTETIYLGEVIDEGLLSKIKSPFSSGNCDETESKVEIIGGLPYVTLKCDNYLLDKIKPDNSDSVLIYKVGEWSTKKPGGDSEEKTLYNCSISGKDMFDHYKEELYMVSRINKQEGTDYYFADGVAETCEAKTKTFYRTKKPVD